MMAQGKFSIRVTKEMHDKLTEIADRYGLTISDILRRALRWMQRSRSEGANWETVKDGKFQEHVIQIKNLPTWLTEGLDHPAIRSGLVLYLNIHDKKISAPRRFQTEAQEGRDYLVSQ